MNNYTDVCPKEKLLLRITKIFALCAVISLFLLGCSKKEALAVSDAAAEYEVEEYLADDSVTGYAPQELSKDETSSLAAPMMKRAASAEDKRNAADSNLAVKSVPNSERKKILQGGCTIRSSSFTDSISKVSSIAQKYNGWTESSSSNSVLIRVPAKNFRTVFDEILLVGEVVTKYENANDITDQYSDVSTRLAVLEKTRVRLQTLLNQEKDTNKKVAILRELKRVDDQIESLKARIEYFDKAVAYSSINVNFIAFQFAQYRKNRQAFFWVENLDPFEVTVKNIYRKIKIKMPDDFAVLKGTMYFHSEAADGTAVRIGTLKNSPEGSADFWRKAIINTIGGRFSSCNEQEAGNVKYAVFDSKSGADYKYIAGITIKRKLIYVIEVYFPSSKSYEKWIEPLKNSLGGLEIK